jgi:hypothetical protein
MLMGAVVIGIVKNPIYLQLSYNLYREISRPYHDYIAFGYLVIMNVIILSQEVRNS